MRSIDDTASRQVSWWDVHQYVSAVLPAMTVESWPRLGTPQWCALDDDDPRKLAALIDASQHWALRLETLQQALADASRDVSGACNWSAMAREMHSRSVFYAARPWLRRVTA